MNELLTVTNDYLTLVGQLTDRVSTEPNVDKLAATLGLSKSAFYNKRRGVRSWNHTEVGQLLDYFGMVEEKKRAYDKYTETRDRLAGQLAGEPLNLTEIMRRAGIQYTDFHRRQHDPAIWKPKDLIKIGMVLQQLGNELTGYRAGLSTQLDSKRKFEENN